MWPILPGPIDHLLQLPHQLRHLSPVQHVLHTQVHQQVLPYKEEEGKGRREGEEGKGRREGGGGGEKGRGRGEGEGEGEHAQSYSFSITWL